jgi:hypothetical protein
MSVRTFPSEDSESRQNRAENTTITDVRTIEGEAFDLPDDVTVFEVDLVNERGAVRENVTIIPRILFESTKDVQYRHDYGIVGKYTRALANVSETAREELRAGIRQKRNELHQEQRQVREADSRLLHTTHDIFG